MQSVVFVLLIFLTGSLRADDQTRPVQTDSQSHLTLFDRLVIELPDGWHSEKEASGRVRIFPPDDEGVLQVGYLSVGRAASREAIRNLTNVDASVALSWQPWGDLAGYHYDYEEKGKYFRQWWLADRTSLVLVVFSSSSKDDSSSKAVDGIVTSMHRTGP